jgi:hypothetical protein
VSPIAAPDVKHNSIPLSNPSGSEVVLLICALTTRLPPLPVIASISPSSSTLTPVCSGDVPVEQFVLLPLKTRHFLPCQLRISGTLVLPIGLPVDRSGLREQPRLRSSACTHSYIIESLALYPGIPHALYNEEVSSVRFIGKSFSIVVRTSRSNIQLIEVSAYSDVRRNIRRRRHLPPNMQQVACQTLGRFTTVST